MNNAPVNLKLLHDNFANEAIRLFEKNGKVHPALCLVKFDETSGQITHGGMVGPELGAQFFSSDSGKDALTQFMRSALTIGHPLRTSLQAEFGYAPDAIVQVNEVWMAQSPTLEQMHMPVRENPNRTEGVMVAIHHRWGPTVLGLHPIIETPTRHVEFREVEENISVDGRMAMTPNKMGMN